MAEFIVGQKIEGSTCSTPPAFYFLGPLRPSIFCPTIPYLEWSKTLKKTRVFENFTFFLSFIDLHIDYG